MTDREKIFEIIDEAMGKIYFREDNINRITDALIAAGIGNVSGLNRARMDDRDEERLLNILKKTFKEQAKSLAKYGFSNTSEQIILKAFGELNLEYKHRAEAAEKSLKVTRKALELASGKARLLDYSYRAETSCGEDAFRQSQYSVKFFLKRAYKELEAEKDGQLQKTDPKD